RQRFEPILSTRRNFYHALHQRVPRVAMRALPLPLRHLPAAFCAGVNRFWFCHADLLFDTPEETHGRYIMRVRMMGVSLKIQSSPKCKARKKFRSAAYDVYVSQQVFTQRTSWDEIWIFRGAHGLFAQQSQPYHVPHHDPDVALDETLIRFPDTCFRRSRPDQLVTLGFIQIGLDDSVFVLCDIAGR